jgi:hypothetical protein
MKVLQHSTDDALGMIKLNRLSAPSLYFQLPMAISRALPLDTSWALIAQMKLSLPVSGWAKVFKVGVTSCNCYNVTIEHERLLERAYFSLTNLLTRLGSLQFEGDII